MTGAWEIDENMKFCELPEDAATAFADATKSFVDARYLPVLYIGKQVVSGYNYIFICKQVLSTAHADTHVVKMVIYKPAAGKAEILLIEQLL
ncbi:hypothetical protein AC369_16550 [Salmonella enterica subsp. diarizonae]|nr:hypothetical protein [Salmonella enterica subsp. diarizonae]EGF0274369.1 hypothetical protein [Salmonella enterica]EHP6631814.1 hypothetical protein [Salmonella enterica]EJR9175476.1 hypothetical protein [Salmonella enterica]EKA2739724.1 hypothetical protein [Salmonella enterica]